MSYFKLIKYFKNTAFFALIFIFLNSCGVNPFERKDPIEPEIVLFGLILVIFGPFSVLPIIYPPMSEDMQVIKSENSIALN